MKQARTRIAIIAGLTLLGVGLAAWAGVGRPEKAQGQAAGTAPTGITVTGTGTVRAKPDQAEFSFGVETQGSSADEALASNSTAVQEVIDAVKGAGVADSDVQTQQVSVSPRYSSDGQAIVGYSAVNTVSAMIRDLSTAGAVVDAAVQAGANQVYGPTLSIAEQSEIYDEALNEALADARDKAATIASAAGVSLGEVVNIVEGGGGFVPPIPYGGDAEAAVPIEPGLQDVQATLTVTFSIA